MSRRRWLRVLILVLLPTVLHLTLLWLWNPSIAVGPPYIEGSRPNRTGKDVVVLFGGDTALTDAATPTLKEFGYEYPFAATVDLLRDSDLTIVNLETVVSATAPVFPLYKRFIYRTDRAALHALKWAGIDAVTLGNNHTMDYGAVGLVHTLRNLDRVGIASFGAGRTAQEARRGVVFELGGVRVGLLSYLEDSLMSSVYERSFAWGPDPGCARLEALQARQDIARMRRYADVIIVAVHWGRTYTGVTTLQRFYGRFLIDAGADAVVGHHPHVAHPIALHRGKPIIYSLGNYAFGTIGHDELRYGLLARLTVRRRRLSRVELIPLLVQNRLVQFKPEPLIGEEARVVLQQLTRDSAEHGAQLQIAGNRAILQL